MGTFLRKCGGGGVLGDTSIFANNGHTLESFRPEYLEIGDTFKNGSADWLFLSLSCTLVLVFRSELEKLTGNSSVCETCLFS